jgi:hypothetical protein
MAVSNDKGTSNSNFSNQYARVKDVPKVEGKINDNIDQTYSFLMNYLKNQSKVQVFMKQIKI